MSLYESAMEKCIMMDKVTSTDDRGSIITTWRDGAEFDAAISYQGSALMKIAEALGEKSTYRVTTFKNIYLPPLSVFRRVGDNSILRVTKESKDNITPSSAGLNMRVVEAEDYIPAE